MLLLIGGTGNVGRPLLEALTGQGAPVRALVRDDAREAEVAALGAEPARGSLEDPPSLRAAMAGVERLFLLSPPGAEEMAAQQIRAVDAAREAGVRHVVKLSSIGADEPDHGARIIAAHRDVEERIEASGMAWTHLRPHWFMQNELGQAAAIASGGVLYATDVTRITPVDARDVAAAAAAVLTGAGHEGRAYVLTGPEAISYRDVAGAFARVLGREVRWEEVSLEQARDAMLDGGLPPVLAEGFTEILARYRRGGVTAEVSPAVARLTGRPPRSFEAFLRDQASTLEPAAA